ncbi:hypothetical protein GCM10027088_31510 [Nocardia goodfellowii]
MVARVIGATRSAGRTTEMQVARSRRAAGLGPSGFITSPTPIADIAHLLPTGAPTSETSALTSHTALFHNALTQETT